MYGRSAPDEKLVKIQSSDNNKEDYLFKHGNGFQVGKFSAVLQLYNQPCLDLVVLQKYLFLGIPSVVPSRPPIGRSTSRFGFAAVDFFIGQLCLHEKS